MGRKGSIQRYVGKFTLDAGKYQFLVGDGDKHQRLTFSPIEGTGYVYLRGKGKVILEGGTELLLGYTDSNFGVSTSTGPLSPKLWPPQPNAQPAVSLSAFPSQANLERRTGIRDYVYEDSKKQKRLRRSDFYDEDVETSWFGPGNLMENGGIFDIGEAEPCYADNSYEVIYSGRDGTWIRLTALLNWVI